MTHKNSNRKKNPEQEIITLDTPLDFNKIKGLRAGNFIYLNGIIYGARDMAHKRIIQSLKNKEKLPFKLVNSTIFYVGPSPAPPGKKSGSLGPTTSARMDELTEPLLACGLRAMIGKGRRSNEIKEMMKKYKAIYFIAVGGVSAYLASKVKSIRAIAYQDLEAEAVHEIIVEDFPLFVAYDIYGGDIFEDALRME